MSRSIEELEAEWRLAIEQENPSLIETLVVEILREHPQTTLASEIRYQRGTFILTEGEGTGMERLARAIGEFEEGTKAGEAIGESSEPWRSLNRTQYAICMARRGNTDAAHVELKKVTAYRPRHVLGLGAMSLLYQILSEAGKEREAKRYNSQRISYARALVRESKDTDSHYMMQFLLSQELLDSEYAQEGQKLLSELAQLDANTLGQELYEDIQAQLNGSV